MINGHNFKNGFFLTIIVVFISLNTILKIMRGISCTEYVFKVKILMKLMCKK